MNDINSSDYWNNRFKHNWETNQGPKQSQFFTSLTLDSLPQWILDQLTHNYLTLVDWGCAQGDGTDIWRKYVRPSHLFGVDFSETAITQAQEQYSAINFLSENWLENKPIARTYDILYSSNTLEHFHDPLDILNKLTKYADKAIILALPYKESNRLSEHFSSFFPSNLPLELNNDFCLVWARVVDCRALEDTMWFGEQIFLIYVKKDWLSSLNLNLSNCIIEHSDSAQELKKLSTQISIREEKLLQKEIEAEKSKQFSNKLQKEINDLQGEIDRQQISLQNYQSSKSWRITAPLRLVSKNIKQSYKILDLTKKFFTIVRHEGIKVGFQKVRIRISRHHISDQSTPLTAQEQYIMHQKAQDDNVYNCVKKNLFDNYKHTSIFESEIKLHLGENEINSGKTVLVPLSFPLDLVQRPNHIMTCFVNDGYNCIFLTIDNESPYFREIAPHQFVTNIYTGGISYFSKIKTVVYICYPFYNYILKYLPNSTCIYDVLDELSVFSLYCDALKKDHDFLLEHANTVIFSSNELLNKNKNKVKQKSFLIKNGVWSKDFKNASKDRPLSSYKDKFIIGCHGAISELLDWELLSQIIQLKNVHLILLGPVVTFEEWSTEALNMKNRVLSSDNVSLINTVPYHELKNYLIDFNAGIIPFVINQKTDYVLPLKMFEYMAMGKKIYGTKTKTLQEYASSIFVGSAEEIIADIAKNLQHNTTATCNYEDILLSVDWSTQMKSVLPSINEQLSSIVLNTEQQSDSKTIDIVNVNFFDWDGKVVFKGGAERYVYDLACLLVDMGHSVRIIQNAHSEFAINYRGIDVVGVPSNSNGDLKAMSIAFREVCQNSDLVIASPLELACELHDLNVIGINHGVYWDHNNRSLQQFSVDDHKNTFNALQNTRSVIAVDTNFINWVRTYDHTLAKKIAYIPNYFDKEVFIPVEKNFNGRLRILYPRRLYEARGVFITLKAFDYLFKIYPDIELHLVGQSDNNECTEITNNFIAKYNNRVIWEERDMEDMYQVYQTSHIVLVPTIYSEGTSLSCIEAMATNNAVIASNVGGLPNLIIDNYNGLLINPAVWDLINALKKLIEDRELTYNLAKNGIQVSYAFDKKIWLRNWRKLLTDL